LLHNGLGSEYYFLWSMERVAVIYDLQKVGNQDWYAIGSKYIISRQENDGAWRGKLTETPDTCFALFFLRRANLAADLTATLRAGVNVSGVATLRAGGAPGDNVESGDSRPAKAAATKPAPESDDWERQVARLRDQLLTASPEEQVPILEKLRDAKGPIHTEALATAIPRLGGTAKTRAGDALATRLTRMTPGTLRAKLHDDNREIRRAAALACAMNSDKSSISDLIGLLADPEPRVTVAAHVVLKTLTHEDFGPTESADAEERTRAIGRWRAWWAKNGAAR
jgi:hypothetical protein